MKFLQLIQKPQLRGAEMFACQLSNQLLEAGHHVILISLFPGDASLPFKGNHFHLNLAIHNRFLDVTGWELLTQQIKKFNPDVVQANAGDTLKYAVLSKLFFGWKAPIVFRNASTVSLYIRTPIVKLLNQFLFKRVNHVISVSELSRQDFLSLFPFFKNRIAVIPVGIDMVHLPDKIQQRSYVLHVGGFTFEKNHERLLHIFDRVCKRHPGLELWLAGDGPLRIEIERKASELGLIDNVKFLGFQSDIFSIMQGAKAMVLPSVIEGLPGVILEAMYCSTPVVAYDVGGISEVVKNGETGWLVKANDEQGFATAIEEVFSSDTSLLKRVTDTAYQVVISHYDNKVIAKRFLEVYETLLRRSSI